MRATGQLLDVANERIASIKNLTSPLPPSSDVVESRMAQSRRSAEQLYVEDSLLLYQQASQIGLAGVVRDLGVLAAPTLATLERGVFAGLQDMVLPPSDWGSSDDPFPGGSLVDMAVDTVVEGIATAIAEAGLQVGTSLLNAVPIIGTIIGAVIDLGVGIRKAVVAQRVADMPTIYKPAVFRPDVDVNVFEDFGGQAIRSGNWTDVFMPPGFMGMVGTVPPFSTVLETDGTVTIVAREPSGGGMIPGTVNLTSAIDVLPGGTVRDLGEFLPTLRKQAMWMWQGFIAQPDQPAIFSVVTRYLAESWSGYMMFLRRYLEGEFQPHDPAARIEYGSKKLCRQALGSSRCEGRYGRPFMPQDRTAVIDFLAHPGRFGWAREDGSFIDSRGKVVGQAKSDDPFGVHREGVGRDPETGEIGNPYQAALWLRNRQFRTLDRIAGAYVDRSYAAINQDADPKLYAHWQLRRGQLLQSGARCQVDLRNVPRNEDGGIWYEQLERSGVGSVNCAGGMLMADLPDQPVLDAVPAQGGANAIPAVMAAKKRKKKGGGGGTLVVAAGVAAALIAWKG